MDLEDVIFIGACTLTGVLGYFSGKNAQKTEYETQIRQDELSELRREVMRLKSISCQNDPD